MASISEPFIRRPVGTTLLAIGLFLIGGVALRISSGRLRPQRGLSRRSGFSASRPGADPADRDGGDGRGAAGAAAWRNRRHRRRSRRRVRWAPAFSCSSPSAATSTARPATCRRRSTPRWPICRATCRHQPRFRKANSAAAPVFVLALTSKTISTIGDLRRGFDTVDCSSECSQVPGVGECHRQRRRSQPAVRIALNPVALQPRRHRHRRRPERDHQRQSEWGRSASSRRPPERNAGAQQADANRGRITRCS